MDMSVYDDISSTITLNFYFKFIYSSIQYIALINDWTEPRKFPHEDWKK